MASSHGPKKSLGQHWLKDPEILADIAEAAELTCDDVVLEIGPGLGTLTSRLLARANSVTAVEFDTDLARKLPGQFPGKKLTVVNQDILQFDLNQLPKNYKVVANVPYYITSKIVEKLMTAENKPSVAVLLVQKEVAERIAAEAGNMSILSVSVQIFAEAELDIEVPRQFFTPPPKVDSQVVVLRTRNNPLITPEDQRDFFRIVKAGFSAKRKKLRSSLSGGLGIDKSAVEELLKNAGISPDARAEDLAIEDWKRLLKKWRN
ncbi:16S rRNA (adenine(1518)-N(6)/adenine(1519)-N(6))-dimethyltransferase RsmA [Candidatus Nanosynbacter sp. HMT-352]|jgi:dimethyladenosine transferase|uniref:16S rRNA (adenine(1518)-N(6)/adenine(1519)-N(6))- dimethyltransferase RsmA n=1 Tax=Candidatus Nanosynbacter sp. HMT-352 TaxID=2899133 RepID=UPI001E62B0EE|nr:16S rRNA (adenine(1518)-N(6)/adenine(1519)-N(6))-dimethyltransferase RsmA [Candidatus Nanosynbacter sp. HMT-352]UHA57173.1 16S rRNA (adenine(1518)-N(6)/adenine(1519)-N(6))-dimethyltransferase RsmA [Candidatus Nanosynbacter sp. HMT-352]